jgi:hypothetical protein
MYDYWYSHEEMTMNLRLMLYAVMALLLSVSAFAQTKAESATPSNTTDYRARLEASSTQIQTGIQALETQLAAAAPEDRPAFDRQIIAMKKQGEISRLQILLEWANAEGDAAKVSEVQTALTNLTTPVESKRLPELEKGPRAPADAALKTSTTGK